ncbi:MAG: amidase [Deltaproteobacteria bacterium]|nr:amidase [Deltaproteobacteria bacterium]
MRFDEYVQHDGLGLAALVAQGEVSSEELVRCAIARIEAVDKSIHAVIHRRFARAIDEAKRKDYAAGPFAGVPFLVKDLDGTLANEPYNAGTRALAGYIAPHDSELFARFKRAGMVIVGKTNTPELGLVAFTEPALHGPTRNPHNQSYTPGGSSGGSAAAVAAGIVPLAHAGDGGGSIRIPASHCGLFGLKPSRGRVPMGPDEGESWHGFVSRLVVSRSVRDSAAMLDMVHGMDEGAAYTAPAVSTPYLSCIERPPSKLRIAYSAKSLLGQKTHHDNRAALEDAMKLCADAGHDVREAHPSFDAAAVRVAYLTVVAACTANAIEELAKLTGRPAHPSLYEPVTWFLGQVGRTLSAAKLEAARTVIAKTTREIGAFFRDIDVFATPTCAHPPARIGELKPKAWELAGLAVLREAPVGAVLEKTLFALAEGNFEKTPNTMLFNMTGQPAMSVPLAMNSEGLPIGTQFVSRYGDEATLLQLAAQLEQARPWSNRLATL